MVHASDIDLETVEVPRRRPGKLTGKLTIPVTAETEALWKDLDAKGVFMNEWARNLLAMALPVLAKKVSA